MLAMTYRDLQFHSSDNLRMASHFNLTMPPLARHRTPVLTETNLNPIEHIWEELERWLRHKYYRSLGEIWRWFPENVCTRFMQTMRRRCVAVRAVDECHTRYWHYSQCNDCELISDVNMCIIDDVVIILTPFGILYLQLFSKTGNNFFPISLSSYKRKVLALHFLRIETCNS